MTPFEEQLARFGNYGATAGAFGGEVPDPTSAAAAIAEELRSTALGPRGSLLADLDSARREVNEADRALSDYKKAAPVTPKHAPRGKFGAISAWIRSRVKLTDPGAERARKVARLQTRYDLAAKRCGECEKAVSEDQERASNEAARISQVLEGAKAEYAQALTAEFEAWKLRSKRVFEGQTRMR